MAIPDVHDDTSTDYEQFENAQLAQDRDASDVMTADVDDATAQRLVTDLVDADVVRPVPDERVLVHEPSGRAFDSIVQVAVFHRGWTAACDADAEAE